MDKTFSCQSTLKVFVLISCGLWLVLSQFAVLAVQNVVLAWMPSGSTNVVGYKIYYGTASQNYGNSVAVGNTNVATISGLVEGTTYYFAAIAVDTAGEESPFSNEAVYEVPSFAATLAVLGESSGGFSFSVSGISGCEYVVESSTDLMNWIPVQTNTAPFTFTDPSAAETPRCIYRAYYLPP